MGKKQQNKNQGNKGHKTLRDKLRKRRQQTKQRKKQKSEKHKQYNAEESKKKYFEQSTMKKKSEDGIKEHKLNKYIQKFVDIYEDDVNDFYDLFGTLDQGGTIDITSVANPRMQKVLKKMFKYLPLTKSKLEYTKKKDAKTNLKPLIKQLLTRSMENYLQNGTQNQNANQSENQNESSYNSQKQQKKKRKKQKNEKQQIDQIDKEQQKKRKAQIQHLQIRQYQDIKLYRETPIENNQTIQSSIGPSISLQQREYLARMFDEQIKQGVSNEEQNINDPSKNQNEQFERIFSMTSTSGRQLKTKGNNPKPNIDDIPSDLLAEGSARIGQKQQIDPEQIQEYNKIHRPRKLIEEHQQMRKLGKYAELDKDGKKKRQAFDRQRDIVNGRSRQFMNNGVFFDFKQRMSKPKSSNNFL